MSLLSSVKIGKLSIKSNVFVAPMAGITDRSFRIIAKKFGAGLVFTEMVSSYAIIYKNRETERICRIDSIERPTGLQLFGAKPEVMKQAAIIVAEKFKPDLIDINAGCPVPKVLKSGAGSKLLESPETLFRIVKSVTNSIDIPVSVKMRLGIKKDKINIIETSLAAQEAGAKLMTLHPRTAEERFKNLSRWEYIAMIKERLSIPVCGNGDIKDFNDAIRMVKETKCDAIMVGRGVIGNPWLIEDIINAFSIYPEDYRKNEVKAEDRISVAIKHLELICKLKGEDRGVREMRRILPYYIKGMKNSAKLRNIIVRAKTFFEIKEILESIPKAEYYS